MNWNEHILSRKAKAEKINIVKCLTHTKWEVEDQGNLLTIHKMIILSTLRYREEAYGSASKAVLKKLEPTHSRGIRLTQCLQSAAPRTLYAKQGYPHTPTIEI
jgi:hypothetical protein